MCSSCISARHINKRFNFNYTCFYPHTVIKSHLFNLMFTFHSFRIYTTTDSLPQELRERLEPYFTSCVYSSREYLNVVQRAFVKYKVAEMKNTGQKLGDAFLCSVISEGVDNRIWCDDFRPSAEKSLSEYLYGRIRNEKRNNARQEILTNTRKRMESLITDELSNISNTDAAYNDENVTCGLEYFAQ